MAGLMSSGDWIAIVAVISSLVVAGWNIRVTERIARSSRRQDRIGEVYVTLTDFALRMRQFALTANPGIDDDSPLRDPPFSEADWLRLRAQVEAHASDRVRALFDDLLTYRIRTATAVEMWSSSLDEVRRGWSDEISRREGRNDLEFLRERRAEMQVCAEAIIEAVRAELAAS
ncbi:MAG: hypothetical protein R2707_14515 [Acidimicrobiales bacterium]